VFNFVLGTVKKQYPNSVAVLNEASYLSSEEVLEVVAYLPIAKQNKIHKQLTNWSENMPYVLLQYLHESGYNQKSVQRLHEWIVTSKSINKGFE